MLGVGGSGGSGGRGGDAEVGLRFDSGAEDERGDGPPLAIMKPCRCQLPGNRALDSEIVGRLRKSYARSASFLRNPE